MFQILNVIRRYKLLTEKSGAENNIIFFDKMLSDILMEQNFFERQRDIQFHFDIRNVGKIYTDEKILKSVLKKIFGIILQNSGSHPTIKLTAAVQEISTCISFWFNNGNEVQPGRNLSYKIYDINLIKIKHSIDKIKGKINVFYDQTGTTINILLPDLYPITPDQKKETKNQHQPFTLKH